MINLESVSSEVKETSSKFIQVVREETVNIIPQGGNLIIKINVSLPDGSSLTPGAPSKWIINLPKGCI